MEKKRFSQLLEEFGKLVGIENLCLDAEDTCIIGFDDKIILNLQFVEDNHSIIIFSNLGKIKKENQLEVFADMLEANFYDMARGKPSVGYSKEADSAMLIYQTDTRRLDFIGFENMIETCVNCAEA